MSDEVRCAFLRGVGGVGVARDGPARLSGHCGQAEGAASKGCGTPGAIIGICTAFGTDHGGGEGGTGRVQR